MLELDVTRVLIQLTVVQAFESGSGAHLKNVFHDRRGLDHRGAQAPMRRIANMVTQILVRRKPLNLFSSYTLIFSIMSQVIAIDNQHTTELSASINQLSPNLQPKSTTFTPHAVQIITDQRPVRRNLHMRKIDRTNLNAKSRASIYVRNENPNYRDHSVAKSVTLASINSSEDDNPTLTPSSTAWPIPSPFDVGFNNNITSGCREYMDRMLESESFKECLPISMLLQNSNSFFQASKNVFRVISLLDKSCNAPVTACADLLNSYASQLTSPTACKPDFSHQNPQISSALLGLTSYRTLYTATCLHPSQTNIINTATSAVFQPKLLQKSNSYCFADAITNISNPTNSYIYYLPLNISLVDSAVPTCNTCLKSTMSVFQQATANRSDVLSNNYIKAAKQINLVCGPKFVNESKVPSIGSSNTGLTINRPLPLMYLLWILIAWLKFLI